MTGYTHPYSGLSMAEAKKPVLLTLASPADDVSMRAPSMRTRIVMFSPL